MEEDWGDQEESEGSNWLEKEKRRENKFEDGVDAHVVTCLGRKPK